MSEDPGTTRMPPPPRPEAEPPVDVQPSVERPAGTAVLVVARGPQSGREIVLSRDVVVLGRSPDCDVVLEDVTVSRQHAKVTREADGYAVTDAGSLNGTFVNRTPVDATTPLADGDEVRIGIFRLVFRP